MGTIIMLVVMIGLLWFMQRSQRKQAQERQDQLNALNKGDEIVTIGGLYGIIDEVDTDNKKMVLDVDGIYLTFELSALKRVVTKQLKIPLKQLLSKKWKHQLKKIKLLKQILIL